jgi:hypothetical protein
MFRSFHDERSIVEEYNAYADGDGRSSSSGTDTLAGSGDGGSDGGGGAGAKGIGYNEAILASKFCIAPVGDSPSCRHVFNFVFGGCVPIIISDALVLPWPWAIPWAEMSVRLPEAFVLNEKLWPKARSLLNGYLRDGTYEGLYTNVLKYRDFLSAGRGVPLKGPTEQARFRPNKRFHDLLLRELASKGRALSV